MADEEQQIFLDERPNFQHWPVGNHDEPLRSRSVDQICVSSRNCTEFFWSWSGPQASRRRRIAKTERAGREKRLHSAFVGLCVGRGVGWDVRSDQHFQRAALHFLGGLRIDEVAPRQNQRPRGQDFGLPSMRKAHVNRSGPGLGSGSCGGFFDLMIDVWRAVDVAMVRRRPLTSTSNRLRAENSSIPHHLSQQRLRRKIAARMRE